MEDTVQFIWLRLWNRSDHVELEVLVDEKIVVMVMTLLMMVAIWEIGLKEEKHERKRFFRYINFSWNLDLIFPIFRAVIERKCEGSIAKCESSLALRVKEKLMMSENKGRNRGLKKGEEMNKNENLNSAINKNLKVRFKYIGVGWKQPFNLSWYFSYWEDSDQFLLRFLQLKVGNFCLLMLIVPMRMM